LIAIYEEEFSTRKLLVGENHDDTSDAIFAIGNGTSSDGNNALTIKQNGAIEGGTADKSMIKELAGDLAGALTTLNPPEANGKSSMAFGANVSTYAPGAVAVGVNASAGAMAYYYDAITYGNEPTI
jgi:hypothetical protein